MSSESESESEFGFDNSELYKFLQNFSPISLHYRKPDIFGNQLVFWSESEGSENNSSSGQLLPFYAADLDTLIIHDKIKSALSNINLFEWWYVLSQFWAPVTIGGRRLLSTSAQPFAVCHLSNELAKYRLNSEKYKYNIDVNKLDIEQEHIIKSGGPAIAFLNCRTSMSELQGFLSEPDDYGGLNFSIMLPICFPSQSNCIGVLEFTLDNSQVDLAYVIYDAVKAIKKAGLDVFYVQDLIPYKTINGLKIAKDQIEDALKVVGESHNLALAQVWIPYEDKSHVFLSSSLEDFQTKKLLAIKLTGCYYAMKDTALNPFEPYFKLGDVTPREIGEEFPLVTLQDYKSRYISKIHFDMSRGFVVYTPTSYLAICLRSNDSGDHNYVFEFIWIKDSNHVINNDLEALLLTLKRCLPGFKFASGVEIGNELDVHIQGDDTDAKLGDELDIHSEDNETKKFKIFQGKRSMVVDYIAHSEVTRKTTPKVLPREVIEGDVTGVDIGNELDAHIEGDETGAELVGELDIHSEDDETKKFKIFQGKRSMVMDYIEHSEVTCKTAPKVLPREVIEKQFGKTMKDAAKNLDVSLSTFKRKLKELGIQEWQGPNFVKRNKNGSSIIQFNTNEEDNGAIEDTSTVSLNKNMLTIKAEYEDDIIKFHLPVSQATFVRVEKEISKKLELSDKTYKIKYLDEDGDLITLKSDEEMVDCIKSSRKSNRIVVRMRVLPSRQPISEKVNEDECHLHREMDKVIELLKSQPPQVKKSMFSKIMAVLNPSMTDHQPPEVQNDTRGRPTRKEQQKKEDAAKKKGKEPFVRHKKSKDEMNVCDKDFPLLVGNRYRLLIDRFKEWLPSTYHRYIKHIRDVHPDGNCGFRSVAVCLGWEEEQWLLVRRQLMEEMEVNKEQWEKILNCHNRSWYTDLYNTIDWTGVGTASNRCWMDMPSTGLLIAQKFGVVVQFFCIGGSESETFFPMFDGPNVILKHSIISFAWVNRNHFIVLQLTEDAPMPIPNATWRQWRDETAMEWETMYKDRLDRGQTFVPRKKSGVNEYINLL